MNIYCFSTLSFAKLQFKSVINKAFHKHGVASFTDAWIETYGEIIDLGAELNSRIFYRCVDWNIFSSFGKRTFIVASFTDAWIETCKRHGINQRLFCRIFYRCVDWNLQNTSRRDFEQSHLLQMRGLKQLYLQSHLRTAKSHLLQMRGLKPWRPRTKYKSYGRIFYRCVDWNYA